MLINQKLLPQELFEHYKVLWTGSLTKGNTVTLNDNIKNYNFVFVRMGSAASYVMCPIVQTTNAVRGINNFISDSYVYIDLMTLKASCDDTQFTFINAVALRLTTSGITEQTYNTITEIIGVR